MRHDFHDVKVGDKVILNHAFARRIAKVERITKEYFVVLSVKYRKKDGCIPGRYYSSTYCTNPTEEELTAIIKEMKIRKVYNRIKDLKIGDISYEQAEILAEMFNIK
jgi:hypothetical protein